MGEMKSASDAASKAFKTWSQASILSRQQILFGYQGLVKSNMVGLVLNLCNIEWTFFHGKRLFAMVNK